MKNVNEDEIIRIFQSRLGNSKFTSEDVEVFSMGGQKIISSIDTLVQSTDVPPNFRPDKIAKKSITACVSDFAAKGVAPKFGLVSVTIPKKYPKKSITLLADGLASASKKFGFRILGGDTNEGAELSLSICLIGSSKSVTGRGGAKTGDLIFVTGPFGYAPAGLAIILQKKSSSGAFGRMARGAVYDPTCRLEFGIAAKNLITSAMDSSDGLSTVLGEMSAQSKKKFVIGKMPAGPGVAGFAKSSGINLKNLVFDGGEEFEFAFTVPEKNRRKITDMAKKLKTPVIEIGRVSSGRGVRFESDTESFAIKDGGWRHFSS